MRRPAILSDEHGGAAEFALVLPLAVLLLFAIMDGGRYLLEVNRAEKATQAGARVAVVTGMIPAGLVSHSFSISNGTDQGTIVSESDFPGVSCVGTAEGVSCEWLEAPSVSFDLAPSSAAFDQVYNRMVQFMPSLERGDVEIVYANSGLGFAGDPSGPDVAPLVTVRLAESAEFEPVLTSVFGLTWGLPSAAYSLSQEDGQGVCFEEMGDDRNAIDCVLG